LSAIICTSGPLQYVKGYKYQTLSEAVFVLPAEFSGLDAANDWIHLHGCILTIRKGYAWNGASGPTFDTPNSMRASLLHDALYQLMAEELLPRQFKPHADSLFHAMLRNDGMSGIRAALWHRAVHRLGHQSTIRNRDILVAP